MHECSHLLIVSALILVFVYCVFNFIPTFFFLLSLFLYTYTFMVAISYFHVSLFLTQSILEYPLWFGYFMFSYFTNQHLIPSKSLHIQNWLRQWGRKVILSSNTVAVIKKSTRTCGDFAYQLGGS